MGKTIVNTTYGQVEGIQENGIYVWKGIPYAKPPVGNLRFRPPERPAPWSGVRDARQFGPIAPQGNSTLLNADGSSLQSEDCLYLNVWSPAADGKRRPVLVWIHGGAFMFGSGSSPMTWGNSFAANGDVVMVSFNYRLGPFGYLYLDEISGGDYQGSGNAGILDQVAALEWIKENIENFGGDPDRVTIFGESAGARSVGLLLTMPAARGLFQQAIIQSGGLKSYRTASTATDTTEKYLSSLGIGKSNLHKLTELPTQWLIAKCPPILPTVGMEPTVDGTFVPMQPMEAYQAGAAKEYRTIIGTTAHEMFRPSPLYSEKEDADTPLEKIHERFAAMLGSWWPSVSARKVAGLADRAEIIHQFLDIYSFHEFTHASIQYCEFQARHGANVRNYVFDWRSPMYGYAVHALEIPFVFNNLDTEEALHMTGNGEGRQQVADQMHHAWIAFAHSGDPSHAGIPVWPPYDEVHRSTMIFSEHSTIQNDPRREDRLLWEQLV